jgi:uncharacterized protein (DUF2236 family)
MLVSQREFERQVDRARAEVTDPVVGLYGPDTVTWRICRESIVFLGAGRAALLQLAHPYVAHAIEQHSETKTDPIGRFNRTFLNVYGMIFGDLESVIAAAKRVRGVHDHIHGPIDEDAGRFAKGHRYSAHDADALLWVLATLVETSAMAYELGVARLSIAEKDAFWTQVKRFAWLFGIPDAILPGDWAAFKAYCARTMASEELSVGRPAKEIARFLLHETRTSTRPLMRVYAALTAGLLPPRLRDAYGLSFGRAEALVHAGTLRAVESAWPRLPLRLRFVPEYVEAVRRLEGKPRRDTVGRAVQQAILSSVRPRVTA